jgi:hypothetical protein
MTQTEKYFYALSDSFTGDNPAQPTSGFANTSEVIAFTSKNERKEWLSDTKLLKAKSLTKAQATSIAEWSECPENLGLCRDYRKVKAVRIYRSTDFINRDGGLVWPEYVALKYSAN